MYNVKCQPTLENIQVISYKYCCCKKMGRYGTCYKSI